MKAEGFALFETAVGSCALAWSAQGVAGIQLPEGGAEATRARMEERFPGTKECEPPAEMRKAMEEIAESLRGGRRDLSGLRVDLSQTGSFDRRVYEATRRIPAGATATYGEIAKWVGANGAARAVGRSLGRNPFAIVVPCHRVVGSGWAGGFSAKGGLEMKALLLKIEGGDRGQRQFEFSEIGERGGARRTAEGTG